MLPGVFTHRVSDLCPCIKIKSVQITGSFATYKSPRPRPSQPCAFPRCRKGDGATAPYGLLAKRGLSRHAALTRTGAAPGKEGADIPALPVKSAFQRLCLGVGKNKKGLPVHMQNSTLCCPNCQAVSRTLFPHSLTRMSKLIGKKSYLRGLSVPVLTKMLTCTVQI